MENITVRTLRNRNAAQKDTAVRANIFSAMNGKKDEDKNKASNQVAVKPAKRTRRFASTPVETITETKSKAVTKRTNTVSQDNVNDGVVVQSVKRAKNSESIPLKTIEEETSNTERFLNSQLGSKRQQNNKSNSDLNQDVVALNVKLTNELLNKKDVILNMQKTVIDKTEECAAMNIKLTNELLNQQALNEILTNELINKTEECADSKIQCEKFKGMITEYVTKINSLKKKVEMLESEKYCSNLIDLEARKYILYHNILFAV